MLPVIVILFFASKVAVAQNDKLVLRIQQFHGLMVEGGASIGQYIDDSLSYGHSNGWIENKKEFLEDLGSKITYHSFKEDSMRVTVHDKVAYARFTADVDATLEGRRLQFHLRVLEVWVERGKDWKLFARQAVK